MSQLMIRGLEKAYGIEPLFTGVTFSVFEGERLGIVGANGCGKSTLLHLLSGREEPDMGEILLPSGMKTAILEQDPFPEGAAVPSEASAEEQKYLHILQPDGLPAESTALSGGERTKLALSRLLAQQPDFLLLDEPTNHLDFDGVRKLLALLEGYPGAILAVSHDRYFLDQLATRVIELENGAAFEFFGNYTDYREEKERLFAERMHRYEEDCKEQKRVKEAIRQLEQWSQKAHRDSTKNTGGAPKMGFKEFHRAKAKRMDKKVKSDKRRLEALLTDGEKQPVEEKNVYFQITGSGAHGKRILEAAGLCKAYGSSTLFSESDFFLLRGEHAAVFGPNGCGKSTLTRLIEGKEQADSGTLWLSPSARPFLLRQDFEELPQKERLLDYLQNSVGKIDGAARTTLFNMGIIARHLQQKIGSLSFGEQMKVRFAEPILAHRDFLILDEPTNHLDLHAREMLEETLAAYEGTLLLISHDIYFLERVCGKVLLFEDGKIRRLEQTFEEYAEGLPG